MKTGVAWSYAAWGASGREASGKGARDTGSIYLTAYKTWGARIKSRSGSLAGVWDVLRCVLACRYKPGTDYNQFNCHVFVGASKTRNRWGLNFFMLVCRCVLPCKYNVAYTSLCWIPCAQGCDLSCTYCNVTYHAPTVM